MIIRKRISIYQNIVVSRARKIISLLLMAVLLSSCLSTRTLSGDEVLYAKGKVQVKTIGNVDDKGDVKNNLKDALPASNKKTFGLQLRLWAYSLIKNPKKDHGLWHWLKYKYGEKPVLLNSINEDQVSNVMINRLKNTGHFRAEMTTRIKHRWYNDKKAVVVFNASIKPAYMIKSLQYPKGPSVLDSLIRKSSDKSFIEPGKQYDLTLLEDERNRINDYLRNQGFFYFSPDMLLFRADTSAIPEKVMMQLTVKPGAPPSALIPYRINKVFIYPSYSELTSDTLVHDTLKYEDYNIIGNSAYINPSLLARSVFLRKGDLYSYENHTLTLKMMSELGLFRFSNIRFEQTPNTRGLLNTYIYLTPREKRYLRAEFGVENKSTDFTGPLLKTSLTNRNVFGGAENFSLNADLGIESQFSAIPSTYLGKFSYKANIHASYEVPGFLTPFTFSSHNYKYLPRTSADLGISFLKRIEYYSLNSVNADFGYKWKETEGKTHDLNLISLNYQHVVKSTPQFDTILLDNSLLARSYEDQFLFGANYNYIFSTQNQLRRRTLFYFNGNIDLGGNLLGLTQSLIEGRKPTVDSPLKILGTKYAQYTRFLADFRTHTKVLYTNTLATRLVIGVGIPYGNSDALPYIKQFFAGGSNSIRAFPARSIGPGNFNPNRESQAVFVDQTGDIRLEANLELRFPIAGSFKAAIFADAGNVWLYNYDPKRPGGQFSFNSFLRQSALGTGLGIRYVSSFLVIRLDAGYPLYIPYLQPAAERWVFNTPSKNLQGFPTLNFAIGYPF